MGETARPAGLRRGLRLLRVEKAQEGCVLRTQRLDLEDSCAGPVLEPGLAEVVLDMMQAAFAHRLNLGTPTGRHHGPNGSFAARRVPVTCAAHWPDSSSSIHARAPGHPLPRIWRRRRTRSESRRTSSATARTRPGWRARPRRTRSGWRAVTDRW